MERLKRNQSDGITANGLRTWGLFFVMAGLLGRAVLQNQMLNMTQITTDQLLQAMESSKSVMMMATASIVLQAIETCAAPVFCVLLVEGFQKTSNFRSYFLRVLGLALVSEIPFNLAFSGRFLDFSSRNPVFSMVLCLVLLYFYRRYDQKRFSDIAIKLVVTLAAMLWAIMLGLEAGACCVVLTAALWLCRNKPHFRTLTGCMAAALCSVLSLFYLAAPMGFMAIHFYNGERGPANKYVNYLAYPALLLAVGLAGKFLL